MRSPTSIALASRYPVTSLIGAAAIAATLYWWNGGDIKSLEETSQWTHQPWRLLTSSLLHVNFLHIAFNLYWLWCFGTILEGHFGAFKTALIYILFATASGAAEFAFMRGGVGLSGVGYGLFGMLYGLAKHDPEFSDALDQKTIQLFVGWFFVCIALTVLKIMPVGNIAHGVGGLTGYLLGLMVVNTSNKRIIALGGLIFSVVICFGLASVGREYVNLTDDVGFDYWQRGIDSLEKGDSERAVQQFQRAVEIKKDEGSLWYNLGIAHQRLQQNEKAIEAYQRAWDLGHHEETRRVLIGLYSHEGAVAFSVKDWPKAERSFLALLKIDDKSPAYWRYLAAVYDMQGKATEAAQARKTAGDLDPEVK